MGSTVRAAALRGFAPLADRLGGDGDALLARHQLSRTDTEDDDAVIDATSAAAALEAAAHELDRADFGLRLAEHQDTRVLGPLAFAIENSPTLGDALECGSRYVFLHAALTLSQEPDPLGHPGVVGMFYRSNEPGLPLPPQVVDLGLGLFHRVACLLAGGSYRLRSALLPHPPLAPVATYTEFFDADVRFDEDTAVLRAPANVLSTPVHGGNETLRTITMAYLDKHTEGPGQKRAAQVRRILSGSMGTTPLRIDTVARVLRLHPRTLQRQLAAEGTTFESVIDDVRRDTALRLLTRTDMPLSQVTAMVGLSEQSALTRAARRWFGEAPSTTRRRAISGHGDSR
ncbi:helix-turn-helix domain-containing protein [Allosaccharopolyspora coralli]|uniref:Helix-turn-helix domain-containing protein n=1 Tax=Allosaccharopolyspora coralli TaxID=2665642 RepID=A0A5Q3Q818_9PSEU|nr:AraC family transcriptional regulator [Allosaccharopolyspora coralli]QGK70513.1 helix-turn-helix domain-containing protein [Allosaccharopolyspora coralli]